MADNSLTFVEQAKEQKDCLCTHQRWTKPAVVLRTPVAQGVQQNVQVAETSGELTREKSCLLCLLILDVSAWECGGMNDRGAGSKTKNIGEEYIKWWVMWLAGAWFAGDMFEEWGCIGVSVVKVWHFSDGRWVGWAWDERGRLPSNILRYTDNTQTPAYIPFPTLPNLFRHLKDTLHPPTASILSSPAVQALSSVSLLGR
jgi:hypothetical protein